jgi:serine/threonine-protein kinase
MPTLVGSLLNDRYRLDAKIGSGGMSTVYRAFDRRLERPVAIKLLHHHIAADSDQIERFRREARAVAQLSHPHIVTVIDAGEDAEVDGAGNGGEAAGRPYIVFEYVEGETLKQRIQRLGRLPVAEAVAYAIEIARALGIAHQRGIVHRDVKPQNVLIDTEGSAKVTDFGIARTMEEEGLTADGRVLGTTDYVSPEQALGHDVSGPSDLYSLGIVLWEMLTGKVPFRGENQVAVAMKHVREDVPDVQVRRPEVSAALASVIERVTAKDPKRRYATDAELIADLEDAMAIETARSGSVTGEATAVLRTLPSHARRRLPFRLRHPGWLAALVIAAVAVAGAGAYQLSRQAQRGTGPRGTPPPGLERVGLGQTAANDFDPEGDDNEHAGETGAVLDDNLNTTWSTERYDGGLAGKPGVGIYVDARPGVAARALELRTPDTQEPGWTAEVYAAREGPPDELDGWTRISGPRRMTKPKEKIDLDSAGQRFGYYLLWITELPPSGQVKLAELYLAR